MATINLLTSDQHDAGMSAAQLYEWSVKGQAYFNSLLDMDKRDRLDALKLIYRVDPLLYAALKEGLMYADMYYHLTAQVYDLSSKLTEAADYDECDIFAPEDVVYVEPNE